MSDHLEDIVESFRSYTQYAEEDPATAILDIEVWRRDYSDEFRVIFTVAVQGPTCMVTVEPEQSDTVKFYHSWGCTDQGIPIEWFTPWHPSHTEAIQVWEELAEQHRR